MFFLRRGASSITTKPLRWASALLTGESRPGALFRDRDGESLPVLALDTPDGQIQTIRAVVNPGTLHHLGPVADALNSRRCPSTPARQEAQAVIWVGGVAEAVEFDEVEAALGLSRPPLR